MGILYEQVAKSTAKVIGFTSVDGYYHDSSKAQIDDKFVGLAIDEDNQSELTDKRIEDWVQNIKEDIL